jgi:hypothetical protein
VFREQQGVVNKLLSVIKDANFNVLFEESSSVQNRNLHEVELICDASATGAGANIEEEEARLAALRRRIAASLIDELEEQRGILRLGVWRMEGLSTAGQRFQEASDQKDEKAFRTVRAKTTIEDGALVLPAEVLSLVEEEGDSRALLVSDTRERILRVFFPHRKEHFTYVRISHFDSVGALAAITGELADDFDIITSLTRVKTQGDENHLELLLFSNKLPQEKDEVARRDRISSLLAKPALKGLNLRVSYPRSVESALEVGVPPVAKHKWPRRKRSGREAPLRHLSTAEILRQRIAEYSNQETRTPDYRASTLIKRRLDILSQLLAEEGGGEVLPRVFLSFDFAQEVIFREVESLCEELGMKVISGRNPTEIRVFRQAIINRVLNSTAFLGVWTAKKKRATPSPWFFWEWGVAQAAGKPTQLLIHKDIDINAGITITPEQHHMIFDGPDFREKAREVLKLLLQEIRERVVGSTKGRGSI